ncbi:MAG: magnesium transporter CorA family protein [Candidatus Magasanikbacteria bacterium]
MAIKIIKEGGLSWINIDQINEESLAYLKENHNFHHLDLEDIQSESQTPKIDTYKKYLFLVLHFPHWNSTTKTVISHEVDIFIGETYLITVQHTKSKEMKNFFYRCMKNKKTKKDWMSGTSGYLLYRLVESLFNNSHPILNNVGKHISRAEDEVFAGEQDTKIIRELAVHRRNILSFRRIIDPQRYLIANLSHTRNEFIHEDLSLYFDNVVDYLNKLWAVSDTYKDTVDGLHVTVESLINQRTNKVIGALTVISVALLPLTLFSGIYGMNIGLPFAEKPHLVWVMFLGLAVFILLVIAMMKNRKWI